MPILALLVALLGSLGLSVMSAVHPVPSPEDAVLTTASPQLFHDAIDEELDEGDRESAFKVHPLAERPAGIAFMLYSARPAVTLLAALRSRRRGS
jgi:hypothetical protein